MPPEGFMHRRGSRPFLALIIGFIVVSPLSFSLESDQLRGNQERMEQFGGSGSIEESCGSITFEEMFTYNKAIFDIRIDDGWDRADVSAMAWINLTLADDIRHDLDAFLDGLAPSGGDGWLSNDEVGIVIMAAADCLEYSITRIGIRDGFPHRGGTGVDWKNATWESNGMEIGEFNGVPPNHYERRECEGFGQGDCYEVPVIPSIERDCDTMTNQSEGLDECRIMLWLNATMEIGGIADPNNFTIGFNSSNMSNAQLDFTFPQIPDLRLDLWEECEGRHVGSQENDPGSYSTPIIGSCNGDGSSTYDLSANEDGTLTYSLFPSTSRGNWPVGEDIFADFTTYPLEIDNPPVWTDSAPENGSLFPIGNLGQIGFASRQEVSSWFDDELGSSLLEIDCRTEGNGSISHGIDGSLWLDGVQGPVEVTCFSIDAAGQTSDARTWLVGVPLSLSTTVTSLENPHPITITPNQGWDGMTVELGLTQVGLPSETVTNTITGEMVIGVPSVNLVPGLVMVWVKVHVDNGHHMEEYYTLEITKESLPPIISVSSIQWNGALLNVDGQFSDPDGESVTFEISVDGVIVGTAVTTGNSWETEIDTNDYTPGDHTIEIRGCDKSRKCESVFQVVEVYPGGMIPVPDALEESDEAEDDGALPAPGAWVSLFAMILALSYVRRELEV